MSAAEIVEAAVEIADAEGLALVTMRRVAVSLGASTMALYRHVPNRNDLHAPDGRPRLRGSPAPRHPALGLASPPGGGGPPVLGGLLRHPWAAEVFSLSRPQILPNVLPIAEWSFATLHAMGLSAHDMLCTHINLFGQVRGMALVRLAEDRAEEDTGMSADDWMRVQGGDLGRWASDHPGLAQVVREEFDFDLDTIFEFGLQRLLDGVAAHHRALGL